VIILDTNLLSEPTKRSLAPRVTDWLDRQDVETLYLAATSLGEIMAGVRFMAPGKRRDAIEATAAQIVARLRPRILPYDKAAAVVFRIIGADARAAGMPISFADGQIAAIARVHGFSVATRDRGPFVAAGIAVINPWSESG
jgi:predicted nucleic acid-binding protein